MHLAHDSILTHSSFTHIIIIFYQQNEISLILWQDLKFTLFINLF